MFGWRYWSGICDDPMYLRQMITYTHLNPIRAGLCEAQRPFVWTSHSDYSEFVFAQTDGPIDVAHALRMFATTDLDDVPRMYANYMRFVEFWMRRPRLTLAEKLIYTDEERQLAPLAPAGDAFYWKMYGDVAPPNAQCVLPDIRDRAMSALRGIADDVSLQQVRSAGRIAKLSRIRRELIAILYACGYRNRAIARCLNVSPPLVSNVAADLRRRSPNDMKDSSLGRP